MLEEKLDGIGGRLPHGRLVEGEVADGVGRRCTGGKGLEECIDDVGGGLEGGCGVEGEVASIVGEGSFFRELGCLFGSV